MQVEVRTAVAEDAEAIVNILNPIIEAGVYTAFDTPLTADEERRYIATMPARGIFQVAIAANRLVGFQSMEPFANYTRAYDHVGVIGTYVDLSCRRQGVGSALFSATFEAARRKHYEKLFTYILAHNAAALRAYTKHGFSVVGTAARHARIRDRYVDAIVVERQLDSAVTDLP
jgi:L-amino acid N-acyltransferase YncA